MQYTRTFALPSLLFELFHLFNFLVPDITPVVLMEIQNAYKGRGRSVEVQCPCTITLSCLIMLLSPFYTLSLFAIYMNEELFKVFSSNTVDSRYLELAYLD